ncbi:T9SS type A sorting domain-containing protein [Flavobacterium gelidilacus]|uniref:T9SS type A sorting domain-containing protein n=1 Tax=Flavobacterium gelidilacus TaxID=206041 RepID=UPI0003F69997|nr:T9SS type A sorting domain-containing protein [Flavobacterium gelidilacus]
MKKLLLLTFLITNITFSQSFQWGKRGGGNNSISFEEDAEQPLKIVTDAANNVYTISRVTSTGLDVDGNTRPFYDSGTEYDFVISSFACDGTYRWSKTIGGFGFENLFMESDGFGNIFIGGRFANCVNTSYLSQIEGDIVISQTPQDCRVFFLVKFDTNGVMQWFKRPQSMGLTPSQSISQTANLGLQVDSLGNSYWLVALPPGTYADGAFISTESTTKFFIFKYDTNGNFINATLMDFNTLGSFILNLRFYRNAQTGQYYLTSYKANSGSASATLGTSTVAGSFFIASFDTNGQKLWHQEDAAGTNGYYFESHNLITDSSNNIYFAGKILGNNGVNFMGFTVSAIGNIPFIIKLNPTGSSILWSTYPNIPGTYRACGLALKGNEIGYSGMCFGSTVTWGTQSIFGSNTNEGSEVLLGRFNTTTGDCLGLVKIPGNVGFDDYGTALAVDSSGDYIVGGRFGQELFINGTTLTNQGSQSDFFIAKYATTPCSTASTDGFDKEQGLNYYPNPVNDILTIDIKENSNFTLYNLQGRTIKQGKLSPAQNTIDCSALFSGCYMLHVEDSNNNNNNNKHVVKVIKN